MEALPLGPEIRRLRLASGITLRRFAARLRISAAHLSDIEHDRRRPSERLLRAISQELESVGGTLDSLEERVTGIDPETRDWVASAPGIRKILRTIRESGLPPGEILRRLNTPPRPARRPPRPPATARGPGGAR